MLGQRGGGLQTRHQGNRHNAQRHQHFDQGKTTCQMLHGGSAGTANGRTPSVARRKLLPGCVRDNSVTACGAMMGSGPNTSVLDRSAPAVALGVAAASTRAMV